jgi:hypothetical protein
LAGRAALAACSAFLVLIVITASKREIGYGFSEVFGHNRESGQTGVHGVGSGDVLAAN